MKIHGIVYIIVGLVVSSISYWINSSVEGANLWIFFYIGIGFIIYGGVRLFIVETPEVPLKKFEVLECSRCGHKIRTVDNYCYHCGKRLREF